MDAETGQAPAKPQPRLWNPRAATWLGAFLAPSVGAFIHAANWRALRQPARAAKSMAWCWFFVALQVAITVASLYVAPDFADKSVTILGFLPTAWLAVLACWASHANSQTRFVKETLKGDYLRRSWTAPLAAAVTITASLALLPLKFASALYIPSASVIASTVRPALLNEWRKNPEMRGAKIKDLTLVRKDGGEFTGFIDAVIGEDVARLTLEVVYDRGQIVFAARPLAGE